MSDVLVVGHICLDVLPALGRPPQFDPGNLYEIGPAEFAPGGGVANVGLALRRLGVDASLIGQTGDDAFGSILRDLLETRSRTSGESLRVSESAATSYTFVLSHPGADRIFLHHPGCNATFDPADVELPDEGARILYFGYPPLMEATYRDGGAALAAWFRRARDRGITTVLDLAMPDPDGPSSSVDWPAFLATVLPSVDLIVPSAHEVGTMLRGRAPKPAQDGTPPTDQERAFGRRLLELGAGAAALTLGERGILLVTADAPPLHEEGTQTWASRELWVPSFAADEAGTTGAGDATAAALIACLLRDLDPEDALVMAAAVAACSVEAPDATSGIRGWDETLERVDGDWERRLAANSTSGWEAAGRVFRGDRDRGSGA